MKLIDRCKLEGVELPKKKEEYETCTRCGGLGKIPNHPHISAHTCDKCNGHKKIRRGDYVIHNQIIDACAVHLAKKVSVERMKKILKDNISCEYHHEYEITKTAQAIQDFILGKGARG